MDSQPCFSPKELNSGGTGLLQVVVNLYLLSLLGEVSSPVEKPVATVAQLGTDPSSSILTTPSPERLEIEGKSLKVQV